MPCRISVVGGPNTTTFPSFLAAVKVSCHEFCADTCAATVTGKSTARTKAKLFLIPDLRDNVGNWLAAPFLGDEQRNRRGREAPDLEARVCYSAAGWKPRTSFPRGRRQRLIGRPSTAA